MMTNCHLFQMEFSPENNVSSDTPISESELEHIGTNKFDHWHKTLFPSKKYNMQNTLHKKWSFPFRISSVNVTNADLVTFTK